MTDESDPLSADPALDPYDTRNPPPFSAGFQLRYRAAQGDRNERITGWALDQLDRLAGTRARDRLFTVSRSWADLRMIDPSIEPSDRRPNWCYLGDPMRANYGVFGVGTVSTPRSWLSMWSLRTSQCTAAPHLARITVPALVVHATADACVNRRSAQAATSDRRRARWCRSVRPGSARPGRRVLAPPTTTVRPACIDDDVCRVACINVARLRETGSHVCGKQVFRCAGNRYS